MIERNGPYLFHPVSSGVIYAHKKSCSSAHVQFLSLASFSCQLQCCHIIYRLCIHHFTETFSQFDVILYSEDLKRTFHVKCKAEKINKIRVLLNNLSYIIYVLRTSVKCHVALGGCNMIRWDYILTRIATWLSPCLLLVLTLCLDKVLHPPALVGGI